MAKKVMAAPTLRRNTTRVLAALHTCDVAQKTRTLIRDSPPVRVLGLDINTNSTGFAVLTEHGRLCQWGHVSTAHIQSSDILSIAHAIDSALGDVHIRVAKETGGDAQQLSWHVGIEDFMRMYRFGRFHNKGIFQLAQLNGIVSYACWQRFSAHGVGATPTHTHPSAARAFLGIAASKKKKAGAKGDSDIKEQVMAFVQQQEPQLFSASSNDNSSIGHSTASLFDKTRNGNYSEAAFDVADAYVIAAFTRWRHFQDQLLAEAPLEGAFADAYMQLTTANADNKKSGAKPTIEECALLTMSAKEKETYLRTLYAHGIDEWLKSAHLELSNENEQ
ncbi:hypothetical protein Gpo141_00000760 [Globisporangium polare]